MAAVNSRNFVIEHSKKAQENDLEEVFNEPYENCEHNNSNSFITSLIELDGKKYLSIVYENKFEKDIMRKLLEAYNCNNNRSESGMPTKGAGVGLLFLLCAYEIKVISFDDNNELELYNTFALDDHIRNIKDDENIDVETSYNQSFSSRKFKLSDLKQKDLHLLKIYDMINEHVIKKNNLAQHKGWIVLELNKKFNSMKFDEFKNKLENIYNNFSIKFYNILPKISYYTHFNIENNNECKKINGKDVLFKDSSFHMAILYLKTIKVGNVLKRIIYFKRENNEFVYFKCTLNGSDKPPVLEVILEDNKKLYKEVKDLNDKNADIEVFYYNIGCENREKIKKDYKLSAEDYAGVYLMMGDHLLNHIPLSTFAVGLGQVRAIPGNTCVRIILNIKNKDSPGICIDQKKTKSHYKDNDNGRMLKAIYTYCNKSNNSAEKWKDENSKNKSYKLKKPTIDYDKLYQTITQAKSDSNKKKLKTSGAPPDELFDETPDETLDERNSINDKDFKIYMITFKENEKYRIKIGYTSQPGEKRLQANKQNIKLPVLSYQFFNIESIKKAIVMEFDMLKEFREKYENLRIENQETEQFICNFDHLQDLERDFMSYKYGLFTSS